MLNSPSKYLNLLFLLVLISNSYNIKAVMLTNGQDVPQESLDKVTSVIKKLKKDPAFINKIDHYEIPPMILTEGLYVLGQTCKNGCQEITLEQFKNLTLQKTHPILREQEKRGVQEEQIAYLYNCLHSLEIIDENNQVKEDDGAVLNASIVGGLDQHIYGLCSRGFKYKNPVQSRLGKIISSFKKWQK